MFARERFDQLWQVVDEDTTTAREKLLDELSRAAISLREDDGSLRPWEEHELGYAAWAINAGWHNLALHCIAKAYAVHQMTPEDYDKGLGLMDRSGEAVSGGK